MVWICSNWHEGTEEPSIGRNSRQIQRWNEALVTELSAQTYDMIGGTMNPLRTVCTLIGFHHNSIYLPSTDTDV
jgi:hypothetical protein